MAALLKTSPQYLCKLETGRVPISKKMVDKYREVLGIDLNVLEWCEYGDHAKLPAQTRVAAKRLSKIWMDELSKQIEHLKDSLSSSDED
jgi:hypothetical protein